MKIGDTFTVKKVVTEDMTAAALGSGGLPVFGTPYLVAMVENAAFTSAEAAEQSSILAEIGTYGGTVFLEWITGVRTLDDASWQEYVDTCNQLGAQRALELEKTAVERYNSI